jgi:tetratricopeptide (TPR) repeat protein
MESKMRSSRLGVIALITLSVFFTTNCSYFNRILSRKNLVEGSIAYKERKFQEAEELFRKAAARDPDGSTIEGRTAQIFLARTLHSQYIGNRQVPAKAEEAIEAYKKALAVDKNDQSSYKAVASLLDNLQRPDEWHQWVTERANRTDIDPQNRAEALTSLASRKNTCANEVTDTEQTKKTVKKDGKDVFQWVKPENPADLETLRGCVADGLKLIDQAVALEPEAVKNAASLNIKSLTDQQLKQNLDLFKVFESARSYKASLDAQAMRLADMEGRTADRDALKAQADAGRARFLELSNVDKAIQDEMDARRAAEEEANSNANTNAAKK